MTLDSLNLPHLSREGFFITPVGTRRSDLALLVNVRSLTLPSKTANVSAPTSVHGLLERAAQDAPDRLAVTFVDGPSLTRAELLEAVLRVAGGLRDAGIRSGDRVALLVGNRLEFLTTYLGLSAVGAVSVPINTALRGDVLAYMLDLVGPSRLVVEAHLLDEVAADVVASGAVTTAWVIGADHESVGLADLADLRPFTALSAASPVESCTRPHHRELLSILFTSGTTGPSKGVMWSHRTALAFSENAAWVMGYTRDDVVYTCLPLFHINALFTAFTAGLMNDAHVVVAARFSARRYWSEVAQHGATVTNMLGAMGAVLWKQAPSATERAHRLRLAMVVPFPTGWHEEFETRFGVQVNELYGSTDTGIPIGIPHGARRPGSCGLTAPGWQVQLVDEHDEPVPSGTPGELVTRPTVPFVGQLGYWRQPDKTWESHRNAWFHTGDQLVQDDEGWFTFQDRLKDAMRVSGENVSSFEVEQVLLSHPDVAEAAVFAVPSDLGEDAIMACVVPEEAKAVDVVELLELAAGRMAYFSVPRYVEVVDALPKTSTLKVRKQELRERGVTARTWDGGQRRRRPS